MSSNAYISYIKQNGEVVSSYLHWDGYPSHAGATLEQHYNSQELAEELVNLGDMSSIYEKITPTGKHSYGNEEEGVCVFYCRDKGEDWESVEPQVYPSLEDREKDYKGYNWYYVFKDEKWQVYLDGKYLTVAEAIKLDEEED